MNKVTPEHIERLFNKSTKLENTIGDKTTVVVCKLPNGFVIVESSSCVDPVNYDFELGKEICYKRIKDKMWELEGYLLQEYNHRKGEL
jgi:hypothetical protein